MIRVLFLCTHNSARSQMAEGLLRHRRGMLYESYSAGTQPRGVNPHAVQVMAELGIDISHHTSEHVETYIGQAFDLVVTVCDDAKETCPFLPGAARTIHHRFEDPSSIDGTETERLAAFRCVRDQIDEWIQAAFKSADEMMST